MRVPILPPERVRIGPLYRALESISMLPSSRFIIFMAHWPETMQELRRLVRPKVTRSRMHPAHHRARTCTPNRTQVGTHLLATILIIPSPIPPILMGRKQGKVDPFAANSPCYGPNNLPLGFHPSSPSLTQSQYFPSRMSRYPPNPPNRSSLSGSQFRLSVMNGR